MHQSSAPASLPTGTVTFLFTDIEGSTQRWDTKREAMQDAVRRHDEILRQTIESHDGHVFKTVGDAFCAAFSRPEDAAAAAVEAQKKLLASDFAAVEGLRVRIALHTGTADERSGDYFGPTVNKVARLLAVGHGTQILLSGVTADLVREKLPPESGLRDLGRHRLKDLTEAASIAQLTAPELPDQFPELRSLDAQPNNLPQQLSSFVGREIELREAHALFERTRLLSLAGPGGVGKTRLAVQLAADVSDEFADGVWFIDLAPLTGGMFISPTMLSTMGVREEADRDTTDTLAAYLGDKSVLIVLDNCEHVVTDAARIAERLLRDSTKLKIIATTREALTIAAETVFRVSTFGESDGVQLFLTRARAVAPSFELTPQNAELVGQICRRLDGIALAIELAAARVKMMSVDDLWKRLDDRFRILTGGSRTALARQQTLRGLIDWSYNLLDESEKVFLRRLAIFAGGFSLDSATAICAFDPLEEFEALDILTHLIDKSLVQFEPADSRYWLLDSTKAYSVERLSDAGEWGELQRRRVAHFSAVAREAAEAFRKGHSDEAGRTIARDYAEYRAVMQWALLEANDVRSGAATAASLRRYWGERALWREGRFWLEHVLQHGTDEIGLEIEGAAHLGLANMLFVAGDIALMEMHSQKAFKIYTDSNEVSGILAARNSLAVVVDTRGGHEEAQELYRQNLEQSRKVGDQRMEAASLQNIAEGLNTWKADSFVEAQQLFEAAAALHRELGDTFGLAAVVDGSARAECYAENFERADELGHEALELFHKVGNEEYVAQGRVHIFLYRALSGRRNVAVESFDDAARAVRSSMNVLAVVNFADACAILANAAGELEGAVAFHTFAHRKRLEVNISRDAFMQARCVANLAAARATLGDEAFEAAAARGRALTPEAMLDAAAALRENLSR